MNTLSRFTYFNSRAISSRAASVAAVDPAIAYAHRELAFRYEALCKLIVIDEGGEEPEGSTAPYAESAP